MLHEKWKDGFFISKQFYSDSEPIGDSADIPALGQSCSPMDITSLLLTFDHC